MAWRLAVAVIAILVTYLGLSAGTFVDLALRVGAELTDPSAYVQTVLGGAP